MRDELLERLILRILRLPPELLPRADRLLANLECGDLSPLSGSRTEESGNELPHSKENDSGDKSPHSKNWPHAPLHRLSDHGTYIVTAGTLHKEHLFRGPQRLDLLESALLRVAKEAHWQLEAWAIFSNHYHFVACAKEGASPLSELIKQLHGETSRKLNLLDGTRGRQVWHNFWDTELTYEKSYFARLNYVHQNAVKHGLVKLACQYGWCSAGWFERMATPAQVKTIYGFKIDRVRVEDDYDPV